MKTGRIVVAASYCLSAAACGEPPGEAPGNTQEIIDNLTLAGFSADEIEVADDAVYLGRDAEVTLAASREMAEAGQTSKEQYRTTNTLSGSVTKICVNGAAFTGLLSTALDLAIENYQEQPLSFSMARAPSTGCSATINAVVVPGLVGGVAGFPAGGLPFGTINIGDGLLASGVDVIEHVITHELGHTLGLRHSDFFNRAVSCDSGSNEGDAGVGALYIPGTPPDAVLGGSLMNACFGPAETGEFTAGDLTALKALYGAAPQLGPFQPHTSDNRAFGGNIAAESFPYVIGSSCAPHSVRAGTAVAQWTSQAGGFCTFQGWVNPGNPHDCRALMLARTGGGFFGGTCLSWVNEVQNSSDYGASNTNDAQVNTVSQSISVEAGQTVTIGTCGVPDALFDGDTYLRVFDPAGAQVAFNDDACGGPGSRLTLTAATSGTFQIRSGCYSSSSCGGTVAWTIE